MSYTKVILKEKAAHKFDVSHEFTIEDLALIAKEALTSAKVEKDISSYVLDLAANGIEFKMLRALTLLGTELKTAGKKLYIIAERRSVHNMLMSEGLSGIVVPIGSMNELAAPVVNNTEEKKPKTKIEVGFINPFIDGVMHVLKVQCSLECQPGKPFLKDENSDLQSADIAGVIGISNPKFMGSISICFSDQMFLKIMSQMFGEEYTEITQELEDGAGEILNMVFGHAKRILNENGYGLDRALPTIVRGKGVSLHHLSEQSTIILPFKTEDSGFYMEICTEKK